MQSKCEPKNNHAPKELRLSNSSLFFQNSAPPKLTQDDEGNTTLHQIILLCSDIKEIQSFLSKTEETDISAMAKTINNKGQLPIDLIKDMALTEHKKEIVLSMLYLITTHNTLNKLSDFIDSNKVLARYDFSPDNEIYKNLQNACIAVNETRNAIKWSDTHPDANQWLNEKASRLTDKIIQMRLANTYDSITIMLTNPLGILFDTIHTFNEKMAERAIHDGVGNCHEMAYATLHFLKRRTKNLVAQLYRVKNGDHVFVMIGEGNNAVVCDSWAGDVYPAFEIPHRLKNHRCYPTPYSSHLNLLTSYNPKFHSIEPVRPIQNISYTLFKLLMALILIRVILGGVNALITSINSGTTSMSPK